MGRTQKVAEMGHTARSIIFFCTRDTMLAGISCRRTRARLSVCLSVTRRYCIKAVAWIEQTDVTRITLSCILRTLGISKDKGTFLPHCSQIKFLVSVTGHL